MSTSRPTPLLTAFGHGVAKTASQPAVAGETSERVVKVLACLLVMALCIEDRLATIDSVEVTCVNIVVIPLILFVFIRAVFKGFHPLPRKIVFPLGLFFLATLASAVMAVDKLRAAAAIVQMFELVGVMWSVALITSAKRYLSILHFMLLVFVFQTVLAMLQFVLDLGIPSGTFIAPMTFGMMMGAGASVAFGLFASEKSGRRWIYFLTMVVLLGGLALSLKRGPWLAFGIAAIAVIFFAGEHRKFLITGLLCTVALTVTLVALVPDVRDAAIARLDGSDTDDQHDTVAGRFAIWGVCLQLFVQHPILGVGPKNFETYAPSFLTYEETGLRRIESHNVYVGILAEGGLIGFFTYLYVCYAIVALGIRNFRDPSFASLRPLTLAYIAYQFYWLAMLYGYFIKVHGHLHFTVIGLMLGVQRGIEQAGRNRAPALSPQG